MSTPTLAYRHATNPSRGLAATGIIFFVKALLALPHLIIVGALQYLAYIAAYIGFFVVAFERRSGDGSLHWHFDTVELGEDVHGLWLGAPDGTEVRRGDEPPVRSQAFALLVPPIGWWTAVWNDVSPDGSGFSFEVYLDVCTPPTRDGSVVGAVDLDRAYYLRDVPTTLPQLLRGLLQRQRLQMVETDELLASTQLNVAITAPGTLRVRNNLADLRGTADLALRGTLAAPVVFGRVEMETGGKVVYAENEYVVERALLTFANPYRVEPFVDLVARTEVNQYRVTLNLSGTLDRLNATFASDPPIADLEIFGLLAGGEPDTDLFDLTRERAPGEQSYGAETFLAGQAATLLGQRVNTLFGFDKFRVAPLAAGGDAISSVRLTVGKRLSKDLLLTYSVDPSATQEQFVTVEWLVQRGLTLVFTQNGDGSYAVDARWEKRF